MDIGLGLMAVLAMWSLAIAIVWASRLGWHADLRAIDPGSEVAIAVQPVVDTALAGQGGSATAALPNRWRRADEGGPKAGQSAHTTTSDATPRKRKRPARRRRTRVPLPGVAEGPQAVPQASEIELPDLVEATGDDTGAAADESNDPAGETTDSPGEDGDQGATGEGEGAAAEGDAVIAAYRARLIRWLAARFRVSGSGLSRDELLRYRVRATIALDNDATVIGSEIQPSGNDLFDAAAERALESIRGEGIPSPPDGYPNALPRSLSVTFKCDETSCD